jgi:hypothetical protein
MQQGALGKRDCHKTMLPDHAPNHASGEQRLIEFWELHRTSRDVHRSGVAQNEVRAHMSSRLIAFMA